MKTTTKSGHNELWPWRGTLEDTFLERLDQSGPEMFPRSGPRTRLTDEGFAEELAEGLRVTAAQEAAGEVVVHALRHLRHLLLLRLSQHISVHLHLH